MNPNRLKTKLWHSGDTSIRCTCTRDDGAGTALARCGEIKFRAKTRTHVALGRVTDPDNLRVVAPKVPSDAVVNVVYKDVLEVGEARCSGSTHVG